MPANANATRLTDLFDPQVVADYIEQKYINAIRFAPLARMDDSLVGRPGSKVTMPYYQFVGAAENVAEGADIPIKKITQATKEVEIAKIGLAVEFTDEALLSGYNNDIVTESADQIIKAIADKVETELLEQMGKVKAAMTQAVTSGSEANSISDALIKFGEDIDGPKVLLCAPALYGAIRKANGWIPGTEIGAERIINGSVGMIHGCEIVVSNRLSSVVHTTYAKTSDQAVNASKTYYTLGAGSKYYVVENPVVADLGDYYEATAAAGVQEAYIVKPGALAIFSKRGTMVEFDRDKIAQTNLVIGSKIFAPYLYDESKVIKLTF